MAPDEGNPAGYWQNLDMDQISEDILTQLSGGWDFLLPAMPLAWESRPDLQPSRERANELIQAISSNTPWGWKDPRASLVLPFWKSLLPDLQVVICLRNPVEVAWSLSRHTGSTDAFSFNLWLRYMQRILEDTIPSQRIITHYDMYFADPRSELKRIVEWLGWSVGENQFEVACQAVSAGVRQQRLSEDDLAEARIPLEVVDMYQAMCADGGNALQRALTEGTIPPLVPRETLGYRLPPTDTAPPEVKAEAQVVFERAHSLIARNRLSEALIAMQQAVSMHPFHARAQNDLGVLYVSAGDFEQALAHLGLAHQLDPDHADTAKNLADAYMQLGRVEDAIQTFFDVVHRHPHDVEALHWLATACVSQGQTEQAAKLFSRILDLEPEHTAAREALSALEQSPPTA
jgi:TolA-binding protein